MSLFRVLGRRVERLKRKVERLKRKVDEAESDTVSHECADCGRRLQVEQDESPDCGCEEITGLD